MGNLVHNERLKLRATFLSNLGIAAFIACFIVPSAWRGARRMAAQHRTQSFNRETGGRR